jgi:hypothetical protein
MVLTLNALIARLEAGSAPNDAGPSDALWIRFGQGKTYKTIDYRTEDGNQIVHVYLDDQGNLVGLEIFP